MRRCAASRCANDDRRPCNDRLHALPAPALPPWSVEELRRALLLSRLLEPAPCSAQRVRVMTRWAWGVVAAAVAITRLESERQYGATCGIGSGGTSRSSCARAKTGAATNSKNARGHVAARNTLACKMVLVLQRATNGALHEVSRDNGGA